MGFGEEKALGRFGRVGIFYGFLKGSVRVPHIMRLFNLHLTEAVYGGRVLSVETARIRMGLYLGFISFHNVFEGVLGLRYGP